MPVQHVLNTHLFSRHEKHQAHQKRHQEEISVFSMLILLSTKIHQTLMQFEKFYAHPATHTF